MGNCAPDQIKRIFCAGSPEEEKDNSKIDSSKSQGKSKPVQSEDSQNPQQQKI